MASEPIVFTSWKEIASYLGKGVRTVQRWEAQFGLPVQRLDVKRKGLVRATKGDLDGWISTHWKPREQSPQPPVSNELETLRRTVAELTSENERLQRELEERAHGYGVSAPSESDKLDEVSVLLGRSEQLLHRTAQVHRQAAQLQQQFAETMDITKILKVLREKRATRRTRFSYLLTTMTQVDRYQPVNALNALVEGACLRGEAIHSQLTLGFTFCQVAAQSIALGHIEHAHRIVERLWPSAHTIARHLYVPNHVSPSKIPELRAELERLEGQITEIEERLLNLER